MFNTPCSEVCKRIIELEQFARQALAELACKYAEETGAWPDESWFWWGMAEELDIPGVGDGPPVTDAGEIPSVLRLKAENEELKGLTRDMLQFLKAVFRKYPRMFDPNMLPKTITVRASPVVEFELRAMELGVDN